MNYSKVIMNKTQLIEQMAESSGLSKADSGKALDAFIDSITKALVNGEEISLIGFGRFHVTVRDERIGRNPQTGQQITIPAGKQPRFTPGKTLKNAIS